MRPPLSLLFMLLAFAPPPSMTQSITAAHANQTAPVNECTSEMSVSECDSKIERDLASTVRNKEEGCLYEPTWRPTDVWGYQTGHLIEVHSSTIVIAIEGEHFTLQNNDCAGDCSRWKPEVGKDYSVWVTAQPEYLNSCLHRVLPARFDVSVDFGRMTQKTLSYSVSRTTEFQVWYSVSAAHVARSPAHIPAITTTTAAPTFGQAPGSNPAIVPLSNDNYYTNSSGNRVHAPANAPSVPAGATALCGDGTYSFSQHRSGTCSHHGGVAKWL
jgi:hypothetical protein